MKLLLPTARADPGQARRRVVTAAAIVVVHLAVAVVVTRPRPPTHAEPAVPAMIVTSVVAPPPPTPIRREVPINAQLAAPAFEIATPAVPPSLDCDMLATLATSLRHDPATIVALAPLTEEPTHAIMAWNGAWSDRAEIQPLRHAVSTTLSKVRADCLDEQLVGPRLLFVEVGTTTVTISFGSGAWSWRAVRFDDQN
jgi:hypothetical protein